MKKGLIIIIAVLITAALAIGLVSCVNYDDEGRVLLKTPKLAVNGNAVTWSSIKNAEKYGVVINDDEANEITITGTTYTVTLGGTNSIKVRAIGDLKKYGYSDYSESVSITTAGKIATPSLNDIKINDDGSGTFSWSSADGAKAYKLEVKTEGSTLVNEEIEGNEYTIAADKISAPAYYSYRIKAISAGEDADSDYSASKIYSKSVTISAPEAPKQSTTNSYGYIEFNAPEHANKYTVEAYKDDTVVKYTVNAADKTVKININSIPIKTPGTYNVRVKAEHSSNNLCAPSEFTEVMKNDGVTPLTLTLYDAPKIRIDGSKVLWDKVGEGVKYVLNYSSGKNTTTTDDTKNTEFDLSESSRIKASGFAGLLVDVTVYVGKDFANGVLDGLKSDAVNYVYREKPELLTEGDYNGYYAVDSIAKLNYISAEPQAKYVLTKNIDCANGIITPVASEFKGILDGNGYSINRFTLQLKSGDTRTYASLFGDVAVDAEIKNLGVFDASITLEDKEAISAAIIANTNNGKLTNINVKAELTAQNKAAGIAVTNKGTITNAFFSGTVSGNNTVGAITAVNAGAIVNARVFSSTLTTDSSSDYKGNVYLGGITGENTGTIKYAGVDGTAISAATHVTDKNVYSGGIAGRNAGSISTAYVNSTGKAIKTITNASGNQSKAYSGGIAGIMSGGSIKDSYAIGGTYSAANYSASFVGEIRGASSIADSYTANVTLSSHSNYIVSAAIDEGVTLKNLYYFNRTRHDIQPNISEHAAVTKIDNRADMADSEKVRISSMSKNTLVQNEFMTLNDMLYYEKGGSYVNTLSRSAINDRVPGKVYGGDSTDAGAPKRFNSSNIASNVTTYDVYSRTLEDGTVITLTKTFKIN